MALISCPECNISISDRATACPSCGYPIATGGTLGLAAGVSSPVSHVVTVAKSRGIYIIIGLLLGGLGLHDFYAGYNGRGAAKLVILFIPFLLDATTGFATGFSIIAIVINGIWSLIDICTVKKDKSGHDMS
ncbi:zinc ribbon domain-containing protein [Paraburkholderia nemoris]